MKWGRGLNSQVRGGVHVNQRALSLGIELPVELLPTIINNVIKVYTYVQPNE